MSGCMASSGSPLTEKVDLKVKLVYIFIVNRYYIWLTVIHIKADSTLGREEKWQICFTCLEYFEYFNSSTETILHNDQDWLICNFASQNGLQLL